MGNLIKESFIAIILIFITLYLWYYGRKNKEISNTGWKFIIAGFSLMALGYTVDAFDDIWLIERYVEDSIFEVVLENILGEILSFIFLAHGIISWIPTIASAERLKAESEEHRIAKDELGKKTSILSGLLRSVPDMVFFKDEDGRYMGCNPAFSEHVNLPPDEVEGKTDHELFHNEKATYFCNLGKEIIATGESKRYEECIGDNDTRFFIETIKAPLFDEKGKCIGVVGISRDITARKELDESLKARMLAEATNKARSEFFAGVSHDIRAPLSSIITTSEMLTSGFAGDLNDKQNRYIRNIYNSSKHLLELINNILDMSKIEAGKMGLNPEYFTISETLQEIESIIRSLAMKKGIELECIVDKNIPVVYADKLIFKQIIYNLLSNAIKFTPEGGNVELFAEKDNGFVRFTISDTGIGISEEDMERLFQPFEQVNSIHAHEGTGLGLSLVKKYIEMHKGDIRVESEIGKGSSFVFELPLNFEE